MCSVGLLHGAVNALRTGTEEIEGGTQSVRLESRPRFEPNSFRIQMQSVTGKPDPEVRGKIILK
jgi:hypothetical protein